MRFVDTSFWIALRVRRDPWHPAASELWTTGPGALVTTNHVLGETWAFLQRRAGHPDAVRFMDAAQRLSNLMVRHVDEEAEADAWRWLRRRRRGHEYSFVDATSFMVMRRLRIREALSFDRDFEAAGFVLARP